MFLRNVCGKQWRLRWRFDR